MSGVICDRRVPVRLNWKLYKTSNGVRVGDGGTDEKTGGACRGGRVEDVTILISINKNGQDLE